MFNYFRKELDWGTQARLETARSPARRWSGADLLRRTIVLCTAVGVKTANRDRISSR